MQNVKKTYKIFLDDIRVPRDVYEYTGKEMFLRHDWKIARNYNEFIYYIKTAWEKYSMFPEIISFDHDLADEHYGADVNNDFKEKTGMNCAKWLVDYCMDNEIRMCSYYCHSMNPVGRENIISLLDNFSLHQEVDMNLKNES
jgi:hypothetical protein